ncbi:MAG: DUF4037 domain-containing protein [Calditrichaeota bacterium]|nr:MAG: DUF4037 domain-containing protein [Calditrichota bacterium]
MEKNQSQYAELAEFLADKYSKLKQVEAIALGGSQMTGATDRLSDIDLYVFVNGEIPLPEREKIVASRGASHSNMNLSFWDVGDAWFDQKTGIELDVMFWQPNWIEEQIDRVVIRNEASVGYTTCFWHTIRNAKILFDRDSWFARLQQKCNIPYPDNLRNAIIAKNHPVLRQAIPAYYVQIKKAIERNDLISINHRVAGLLASYFEVIFAVNRVLNPGEKKILSFIEKHCEKVPPHMAKQIERVLQKTARMEEQLLPEIDNLIDGADDLLRKDGIDPEGTVGV